jgi:NAD(P)-dependent dehydrogenase (short-subunit alcohol dehydrogenase family)
MSITIDLEGRAILVCGVLRGSIGGATARRVAEAGANIVAVDLSQQILDETIADIEKTGGKCKGIVADLMVPAQSDTVVEKAVQYFNRLDGVANVAGGTRDHEWVPLEHTSTTMFRETLNLNLEYVFRICRDVAASMIRRKVPGSLVNVGSVSSLSSAPLHGPYGAGKAGIAALTRTMAYEWGRYGIRANTVSPGAVLTQRNAAALETKGSNSDLVWTSVDELANAIVILLSDLASGISGQNIVIDSALSTKFCCGSSLPFEIHKANPRP